MLYRANGSEESNIFRLLIQGFFGRFKINFETNLDHQQVGHKKFGQTKYKQINRKTVGKLQALGED